MTGGKVDSAPEGFPCLGKGETQRRAFSPSRLFSSDFHDYTSIPRSIPHGYRSYSLTYRRRRCRIPPGLPSSPAQVGSSHSCLLMK
ncbi:hypothetical protein JMJ77_0000385, partial [Colletotrichum scovillei]